MNVAVSNAGRRWLWIAFWILVVFLYAPLVILVIFSFNDRELVSFPWEGFTLRWYQTFVGNTEITDALLGFGAWRVIILDTGLSTIAPVELAVNACRNPSRIRHVKLFAGPRFKETARALKQQPYGTHADEIETSLMLAIAPELVDMTRAEPMPFSPAGPARGPLSPDDPSAPNYAPSGSFGDPTLATPDKGSRVLTAILADMVEAAE